MSSSFGHQEAKAFMANFVKLDEVRQGIRSRTPEDAVLTKSETEIRARWLFSQEAMKHPAEEGKRIAKLLYEHALTAGGDTDFIIEDYFPGYFENNIFMATDKTDFPLQVKSAYIALAVPFYEATRVFKPTIEKRPLTPEEQKTLEMVREIEMSWFKDEDVELHPVREGKRLGELLYKHASVMEFGREFALESYFPKQVANNGAMLIAQGAALQNCFQIFTTSASKAFREAKGQEGN